MGLYKKLDFWSVCEGLEQIIDYEGNGNEKDSPYWDFYREQIWELGILAGDMWQELQEIKGRLWYLFPERKIDFCGEDECGQTSIAWWNTAASMLTDTDMGVLLESENLYLTDEWEEKRKRVKAFERLTKKQQMILWTDVIGFVMRYLELMAAFETISGLIRELDYHRSFGKAARGGKSIWEEGG